jgi:putative nucleotidyltransferase with HDIG domain
MPIALSVDPAQNHPAPYDPRGAAPPPGAAAGIDDLLDRLAVHHPPTYDHCRRVASLSRQLATCAGLGYREVAVAFAAGLLHDVGHLATPRALLCRREPLTAADWRLIHRHPETGAALLRTEELDPRVAACAAAHHERPDGSGYPNGSRVLEPITALVAVASAFDTITYNRWLEQAQPQDFALRELRRMAGTQFDVDAVRVLHQLLGESWST